MKVFVVRVTAYIPYPIVREYTEKASTFATAINRAVAKYKKDPRAYRKRIKQMSVSAGMATL